MADDIKKAVMEALDNYSNEVTETVKDEITKANREALRTVKRKSPILTGDYRKGWSAKKMYENSTAIRFYIYNKTDWQLTHLLEYGHVMWLWGIPTNKRVEAIPHIRPTAEAAKRKLPEGIKARLK